MRTNKYNLEKYKQNYLSNIRNINDSIPDELLKPPTNNNSMKKSVTLEVNLPIENLLKYNYMSNDRKNNNISSRAFTHSYDYNSPIFYKSSNDNNYIHYISDMNNNTSNSRTGNINMNNYYKTTNNNIRLNNYLKDFSNNDSLSEQQEVKVSKSKQKNKMNNLNSINNINNKIRNKSARNKTYYNPM